jgi:hypothetical protein
MNWVLPINLHRNKFLIVLIKKEYQQRLQTNDIIKSDPNTLYDEYWKDDIQNMATSWWWNATFYE